MANYSRNALSCNASHSACTHSPVLAYSQHRETPNSQSHQWLPTALGPNGGTMGTQPHYRTRGMGHLHMISEHIHSTQIIGSSLHLARCSTPLCSQQWAGNGMSMDLQSCMAGYGQRGNGTGEQLIHGMLLTALGYTTCTVLASAFHPKKMCTSGSATIGGGFALIPTCLVVIG